MVQALILFHFTAAWKRLKTLSNTISTAVSNPVSCLFLWMLDSSFFTGSLLKQSLPPRPDPKNPTVLLLSLFHTESSWVSSLDRWLSTSLKHFMSKGNQNQHFGRLGISEISVLIGNLLHNLPRVTGPRFPYNPLSVTFSSGSFVNFILWEYASFI